MTEQRNAPPSIDWMTIRDCACENGRIESDWDAGVWYPCSTCNPNWCRIPFGSVESPEIANEKENARRVRSEFNRWLAEPQRRGSGIF